MKSLDKHNAEQREALNELQKMNEPHLNGIACPECGKELWDSDPMVTFTSYPAQKNIHCLECGYMGYRLA